MTRKTVDEGQGDYWTVFCPGMNWHLWKSEKKYGSALKCLAENILKDCHEAGECYNDMLLGAWNRIPPEEPENLFAYLARIIRNIAIRQAGLLSCKKEKYEYCRADRRNRRMYCA